MKKFLDHIARGKCDSSLITMARHTSSAMSFGLGCEGMAQVQTTILEIYALYLREFPTGPPSEATLPSTETDVAPSAGVYTPAHIQATNKIESEAEYHEKLSAYQEQ